MEAIPIKKVFQNIRFNKNLDDLMNHVNVTNVTIYESQKTMTVAINSPNIIEKRLIYQAEKEITESLPRSKRLKCVIKERFDLSSQYTLKDICETYKDSFLEEMKTFGQLYYLALSKAEWFVNADDIVTLALPDTIISRSNSSILKEFLEGVFLERFNKVIEIGFDYTEEQKTSLRKANEELLRKKVREIEVKNNQIKNNHNNPENSQGENQSVGAGKNVGNSEGENQSNSASKSDSVDAGETGSGSSGRGTSQGKYANSRRTKGGASDPDVFYARECEGAIVPISELYDGYGVACLHGMITKIETTETRSGKFIIAVDITDFGDTITAKLFVSPEDKDALLEEIYVNGFYIIKGTPLYDSYGKEVMLQSIKGIKKANDFREKRSDDALEKRVELHLHTCMSEMDSVVAIKDIINKAKEFGHKAIAITDSGVVQAFPTANHMVKPDEDFKIIYGVEANIVDDLSKLVANEKGQAIDSDYVVFDIETTGLSATQNKIIEIGAVKISGGVITDSYNRFVNPKEPIPFKITTLTSITDSMVKDEPTIDVVLPDFLEFVGNNILVAHNAKFDTGFIKENAKRQGLPFDYTVVDTMTLAHVLIPEIGRYTLDRLCKYFQVKLTNHHRACDDAQATAEIFLKMKKMIQEKGIENFNDLNELGRTSPDAVKKARSKHATILAKNDTGRVNLYRLISKSHIDYFYRHPRMPKSLIQKYRDGLIIGSACLDGELYSAILYGESEERITNIVKFYDYLEVQPAENYAHLIDNEKTSITTIEDLQDINKRIYELGKQFNKLVVATGDVHFIEPEDEIYRRIIMVGKKAPGGENQPPLYFRTTREMLDYFEYLGSDIAKEIVITNTNKIADMIEKISPVRLDKQPPIIENSDEILKRICYEKAHQTYGENLPLIVTKRLEKELHSIISNGFAVMYIIAQKLVWKSNEDGYLVGSRGSVGSSFVATMAGITEVNPLPAHYICPECFHVDFDSEDVKKFQANGSSGCDMPDMNCPHCNTKMIKEGHDIPFETFLGFEGDKEPDIDLNFSGDYQAKAHAYTEELFGKGNAFKAGTIGGIGDKTAFGYVYNYFKDKNIDKRRCEIERLAKVCEGIKRTTGQHPGGIIVLPDHEEIHTFTPIQRPANDMKSTVTTTHFDYHSIDHNLLKLDILGHDDPTMLKRLEDLTGVKVTEIPLDDPKVMSLFHNTKALGIEPSDIGGTKLGTLGVPEFGTGFAMEMLIEAEPKAFSDLVRIAGLSHGTDVWVGNAQDLIKSGTCDLSSAICTRDDIMTYLMHMGLESGAAFAIMESVRKGKGLRDEWEEDMRAHGVPDWYIDSCIKIKYMFPKAHAAAYVMMSWRVAYYKVNYPIEYYTAFFSIRSSAFDYKEMCQGKAVLEEYLKPLLALPKSEKTSKVKDSIKDMKLVQEMYARGIEFLPIDLYLADATEFKIIDNKIMPSFSSINGMGEKAAQTLMEAARTSKFSSKEDIKNRGKVSKTVIEEMSKLGLLEGLSDSDQYDFFSLL